MIFSCLFHRWSAGRNADESGQFSPTFLRHAESCPRCAAYSQRMRSMDARLRSVRLGESEFPEGLHAKIMGAVSEVQMEQAKADQTVSTGGRLGIFALATCGAAALVTALVLLTGDHPVIKKPAPEMAESPKEEVNPPKVPMVEPKSRNVLVPTGTRVAQFTNEFPGLLADKVSKPYEAEINLLADDLNAASEFLQDALFVSHVRSSTGL